MNSMTQQIQRKKKQIPKELQEALDAIPLPDFEKLQPKVDRVMEIGRKLSFTDKELGVLIRKKMSGHYGHNTKWRVFEEYPEARQKHPGQKFPKKGNSGQEFECPKCHRSYVDPNTGQDVRENEIWMFHADQFDIRTIHKAPRRYVEDALEHFYAKSLRVHKPKTASNKTKKLTQGTQEDKHDLFRAGLKHAVEERAKRGI